MSGTEVQTVKIPGNFKFIRALVGKDVSKIKLARDIHIIANNNAPVSDFNRILKGKVILGSFLIIATKNNKIVSMDKKAIRRYTNMFKLRKHKNKIEFYREKYLEEYYTELQKTKQKNIEQVSEEVVKLAAQERKNIFYE